MAYQQSDLDQLDAAILDPTKKVVFADGRSTEKFDLDQLRRLRADVKNELAAAAARSTPPIRTTVGRIFRR